MKLLGNSAYGKTLTNIETHQHIKYVTDSSKLVNNKNFLKQVPVDQDMMEVSLSYNKFIWKLPIQIGFFVYQYAKLRMLEFYYECLLKYLKRECFELCEMDTDSYYMAISSGESLDDIVHDKQGFYQTYHTFFPSLSCKRCRDFFVTEKVKGNTWLMKPCCETRFKKDKRTPGLFKLEYTGDSIIALGAKDYICYDNVPSKANNIKSATKGLSKRLNDIKPLKFMDVLRSKRCGGGVNRGFTVKKHKVFTYEQERKGLAYLYIKRKINPDRITTKPLSI